MGTKAEEYQQAIVEALSQVTEPTGKNLMDAGIVAGLKGEDANLNVLCRDPGFPEPIRQRLTREIKASIQSRIPALADVVVEWQTADQAGQQPAETAQAAPAPPNVKHIIAVGAGKGGVGKSTIAASLAYALKMKGGKVGLMDADVYGPSIPTMLGVVGQPRVTNNRYIPPEVDGIKVMSMGFLVPAEQAVVWRGPMLHKAVRDFLFMVEWGPLDYLVVDLPPGTGDVVLSLSQQLPVSGGVIVCTPQKVALLDARKALNMLGTVKIACRGVVENMRSEIFGSGGAEEWAKEAGVPFLGAVPLDPSIRITSDDGRIGENLEEGSPVREPLLAIADRLIEGLSGEKGPAPPEFEIVG
ncbi:Septum site-determining protein MinD [Planctomycetes bacterium Pan216]|uniref:Iron-sulfur cluster carrier protein n=1 Tax=Kolteria novifilia TaxID=2527975 RepID=A0A518BAD1_9BACT|nr:Septum site-determining protein MinD [Planctomycetes bacterium Pan216]